MVHGFGKEKETTKEGDGAIDRRGEKQTIDDLVVWKWVQRTDSLGGGYQMNIFRSGKRHTQRISAAMVPKMEKKRKGGLYARTKANTKTPNPKKTPNITEELGARRSD